MKNVFQIAAGVFLGWVAIAIVAGGFVHHEQTQASIRQANIGYCQSVLRDETCDKF